MKLLRSISKRFRSRTSRKGKDALSAEEQASSVEESTADRQVQSSVSSASKESRKDATERDEIQNDVLDDIWAVLTDLSMNAAIFGTSFLVAVADYLETVSDSLQNDERWDEIKHELLVIINGESSAKDGDANDLQKKDRSAITSTEIGDEGTATMNKLMTLFEALKGKGEEEVEMEDKHELSVDLDQNDDASESTEKEETAELQEECIGSEPIEVATASDEGIALQSAPLV